MEQLIAHLIGDYILQTDHMADRKTKSFTVAYWHALVYAIPFFFITTYRYELGGFPIPGALTVIIFTHAVIDRWRLARYIVWAKNQMAPAAYRYPLSKAAWHGYQDGKPDWLAGWLYIIADNALHLLINYLALRWL